MTSSKPYLLRALYDWITHNQLTPHLTVNVLIPGVHVPQQYVKDNTIILNIASQAIAHLVMTNDWITFDARFSGVSHRIRLPIKAVIAIYAVENGRGMMFDKEEDDDSAPPPPTTQPPMIPSGKTRPSLKVVK